MKRRKLRSIARKKMLRLIWSDIKDQIHNEATFNPKFKLITFPSENDDPPKIEVVGTYMSVRTTECTITAIVK